MFIGRGQRVLVSPSFLSARAAARLIAIALALATGLMDSSFAYANEAGEAPAASDSVLAPTPSAWQRQPKDDLKIKFGIEVPRYNFEILAPENVSGSRAKFEPNTPSKTAIGFSYRNLGLNLATSNSADADSVAKYGSSSSTDLQLRLFGKRTYEFYFQEYNGYFISNSEDLDPAYKAVSSKIKRPDIKSKNFGVNFFWSLHESDFSQAVAWEQLGWQERSSWGVSWLVHLSQNSIEADAVLIPSLAKASFGNLGSLKDFHSNTLATGFGLGGTLTWQRLYASGFFGLGLGYQRYEAQFIGLASDVSQLLGQYSSARLGVGYNGRKHVFSFQILSDSVISKISMGQVAGNSIVLGMAYAYRFTDIDLPIFNQLSSYLD